MYCISICMNIFFMYVDAIVKQYVVAIKLSNMSWTPLLHALIFNYSSEII